MKILKLVLPALLGSLALLAAADATGKWTAEVAGRGGNTMTVTMNLKADGDKLTGTVSGRNGETEISDGKVEGQNVSFNVVREFNGNKMTMAYKGKLDEDTIHFTMSGGPMSREFDAKRSK